MYDVKLTESYFPAQSDDEVLETTVGGVLRAQAAKTPDAEALIEADMAGALGGRWRRATVPANELRCGRLTFPNG